METLALYFAFALEFIRTQPAAVAVVVGFVTPLVISVLQQPTLSKWQRTAVSIAASVVLGGGAAYATGMFDSAKDLLTVVVVLYTASETFYQKLWKQIGLTQQIEQKTTIGSSTVQGEVVDEGE